jgi:hypothetical protein
MLNIKYIFLTISTNLKETFFQYKFNELLTKIYVCLYVKCPLHLLDFSQKWIFPKGLEKFSKIKCLQNSSNGSRVVRCQRTDRQRAMKKQIFIFPKSANHLIWLGLLYVYNILKHILTVVRMISAEIANCVTVVINCYDSACTKNQCCKSDKSESYYETVLVKIKFFELRYV